MDLRPLCALDDCDRLVWGDEAYCRRHLHVTAPAFVPVPALPPSTSIDDDTVLYPPTTAAAEDESE